MQRRTGVERLVKKMNIYTCEMGEVERKTLREMDELCEASIRCKRM